MNAYDKITDNLYLGNSKALDSYKLFKFIVNCTKEKEVEFPQNCNNCFRISINDIPDESSHLLSLINTTNILDKIHNQLINKDPVLVHCHAGRQRSCAVVACYLIKYYNMTPIETIDYIKSKRQVAFFGSVNFADTINNFYIQSKQL
jgi:protein tyrosine/serine phosphatase